MEDTTSAETFNPDHSRAGLHGRFRKASNPAVENRILRAGTNPGRVLMQNRILRHFVLAAILATVIGLIAVFSNNFGNPLPTAVPTPVPATYTQPNIIFIMADDLGKELLLLYDLDESVEINTPHIDRLAAEGIVFNNAYASPICLVTRVELVTGLYPFNNGFVGHYDNPWADEPLFLDPRYRYSFASPLKEAGYATVMAGKWHGNNVRPGLQTRILRTFGFDEWMIADPDNLAPAAVFTHDGGKRIDAFPSDALLDFVNDFIERHSDQPFFVYYPMHLVHRPLVATPLKPDAETNAEKLAAMTEYADHLIGRLIQHLEELGLRDDTIIFFSGDNGAAIRVFNEKRTTAGGKGKLTETGVNVPLIVSGGPVVQLGRTDALTDFTDVLPTLAEFAGVELPEDYRGDGHSIASFLTGQAQDTPRTWIASAAAVWPVRIEDSNYYTIPPAYRLDRLYWHPLAVGSVVRDRRFKLWHYPLEPPALFDLDADPGEKENLWDSRNPEVAAAKRRLQAILDTLPSRAAMPRLDPIDEDYGMFAHWRFDRQVQVGNQQVFPDSLGGYDAITDATAVAAGKFGSAMQAPASPSSSTHFIDFFAYTGQNREFRRHRRQNFTLSAWVNLAGNPVSAWHLLRQPAIDRPLINAGLRRIIDDVEQDSPVVTTNTTRTAGNCSQAGPCLKALVEDHTVAMGESRQIDITASNLDPSQDYLVRMHYDASLGLGSRPDCSYHKEDLTSEVFSGRTAHTATFTLYNCTTNPEAVLDFSITKEGELALQLMVDSEVKRLASTPLPQDMWTHVAATWDAQDTCGEVILYVNGQEEASACLGRPLWGIPENSLLLGGLLPAEPQVNGETVAYLDDVGVWRQTLAPGQIAALHTLGNRFGYDAAQVDTLFNIPRNYEVEMGGRLWSRISQSPDAKGDLLVVETAGGATEIHFGGPISVSAAPALPPPGE